MLHLKKRIMHGGHWTVAAYHMGTLQLTYMMLASLSSLSLSLFPAENLLPTPPAAAAPQRLKATHNKPFYFICLFLALNVHKRLRRKSVRDDHKSEDLVTLEMT